MKVLIFIVLSRVGGFGDAGTYATALAITTPLFLLSGLSSRQLYVGESTKARYLDVYRLRWFGVVLASALALLISGLLLPGIALIVLALAIVKSADFLIDLHLGRFQKKSEYARMAVLQTSYSAISSGSIALSFLLTGDLQLSLTCGAVLALGFAISVEAKYKRGVRISRLFEPFSNLKDILKVGSSISASSFLISLSTSVPVLILSRIEDLETAGIYAALFNFSTIANTIYASIAQATFHKVSFYTREGDMTSLMRFRRELSRTLFGVGLCLGFLVWLWGAQLFEAIFGGPLGVHKIALIPMGLLLATAGFGFIADSQLIALKLHTFQIQFAIVVLVVAVIVHAVLISYLGLVGAVTALTSIQVFRVAFRELRIKREIREITESRKSRNQS